MPILDDAALAACLAYVDLNPIRAQIAETPETSRFTSVYERIQALGPDVGNAVVQTAATLSVEDLAASEPPPNSTNSECEADLREVCSPAELRNKENQPASAAWLSPFELSEATETEPVPGDRASNKGCLAMSFAEYLNLLDWTGRQLRADKRGAIPADLAPILERLQVSDEGWMQLMGQFSRMFRRAAGRPQSLQREREARGCQVMQGIRHSRAIFS